MYSVSAQTSAGRISGSVFDPSGAAIRNASITVINERTNEERSSVSKDDGTFETGPLQPSTYTLRATQSGFSAYEIKGLTLQVGEELRRTLILQVTGTSTAITVEGGALAVVDVSSAKMGVNVSEREVAELPLNGRQISQLYLMSPGAVNSGSGGYDNIRFNGRSNQQNVVRFDGIEGSSIIDASPGNLNGESTSNFRLQQSLENVQEFRVDSSNYPAEYGTGTGGQISVITKSGSNAWHGSLFENLRNDYFDARNFFSGSKVDKLRLNQFGGSVGGRIVKDKVFFFGSYEALRQRTEAPFVETTLSAFARSQAVPSIRPLLAAFPIGQIATSNRLLDLVTVTGPGKVDEDSGGLRLDYNISDRYRLYARYFRDQGVSSQTQNSTLSTYNQTAVPQNAVIALSQVFSASVINETKVGLNAVKERVNGVPGPSPDADISGITLNLSGSTSLGGIAGQTGSASIAQPTGLIRLSSAFNGRGAPYTNYSLSFIDQLTFLHGAHSYKFGAEIRPVTLYNDQQGGATYSFADVGSFLTNTPTSISFNGDLSALSPFTGLSGMAKLRQNYYIFFGQDEWRIKPNLTLNYGLRYEYYSPMRETRNKNVLFDMLAGTIIPKYTGDWYASSKLNLAPRLGITWSPGASNKTVFRAGAGYFYGPGQTEDQIQPEANDRIGTTISNNTLGLLRYPLDIPAVYANYNINSSTLGYQPRAFGPGYQIPEKILSFSASIQHTLPGQAVLTVGYVGSQGRNLFLRSITNKIIGFTTNSAGVASAVREFGGRFAEIDYKTSGGTDNYNSMQVTVNRRYASGLTLGAQYTWGHAIGNSAGSNEANTAGNPFNFAADRGSNNFDIRHSFNMDALYQLPFAKKNPVVGGWQLGGMFNARSGVPIDVLIVRNDIVYRDTRNGLIYTSPVTDSVTRQVYTTPVINTLGGGSSRNVRRPDVIAGVNPYLDQDRGLINPAAFTIPQPGQFGNSGRNSLSGPSLAQLDLTLSKRFYVRERANLEFRAEVFNILNRTNFANPGNLRLSGGLPAGFATPGGISPSGTAASIQPGQAFNSGVAGGNFGVLNSTVSNQVGIGTNRQIQLSLRLNF